MKQPGIRQARYRAITAALAVVLTMLITVIPTGSSAAPTRPAHHIATGQAAAQPQLAASGAIAVDLTTGIELYAQNADAPLPPASTMKIVTALVARSVLPLDERVIVQESDIPDITVFSTMGLQAGDDVSVRDLLQGLLIQSGGDAAIALSRVAGSRLDPTAPVPVDRFVQEMNSYAVSIGMSQSHFSNPLGTDDPANHYASARDLVRATEVLLRDQLLAAIVRTTSTTVDIAGVSPRTLELKTTNLLLEQADVFGIKTGTEELAGQCLITGFWRGDNQVITVVLGSPDRYADTIALMSHVDATYRWLALGIGTTSLGASDALAAEGLTFMIRRTILMTTAQADAVVWELVPDPAPVGTRYGVVLFTIDGREVARLPVYSAAG